jgi:hypothetical protein
MSQAKLTGREFTAGIIAAVIAFRQKWDADLEVQRTDRLMMSPEQRDASAAEVQPEEQDAEAWYQAFASSLTPDRLEGFALNADPDFQCIAALHKGEPSFTLRGQDIYSGPIGRLWLNLAENAETVEKRKLNMAEGTIERLEDYEPKKYPD